MSMVTVAATTNTPAIFERVSGLVVCDKATYEAAAILLKDLKVELNRWIQEFEEPRIRTKAAYDWVLGEKRKKCIQYEERITIVGNALNDYATKLEAERQAAQVKAYEAALAAAEKEQQALLERAAAAKTGIQQDALLERAEMVFAKPVIVPREIEKTIRTEAGNITQRTDIEVVMVDMKLLCGEIAAGRVPITVVEPKAQPLKAWAKAMGVRVCPGLVIRDKTIVV